MKLSVMLSILLLINYKNKLRPNDEIEKWIQFVPDRAFQDYRYSVDTYALKQLG